MITGKPFSNPKLQYPCLRQAGKSQINSKFESQNSKLSLRILIWNIGACLGFGISPRPVLHMKEKI
jgi:hypothetical protein